MTRQVLSKGLSLLDIDTSVHHDNVGEMQCRGSSVYFYLSTAEHIGKGALLMPFRWVTGNTTQRMAYIVLYNVDDETIKLLNQAFQFNNTYMNLAIVKDVLEKRGKSIADVDRSENRVYDGDEFKTKLKVGLVGFEIWLE